jgi:hypothetical protein
MMNLYYSEKHAQQGQTHRTTLNTAKVTLITRKLRQGIIVWVSIVPVRQLDFSNVAGSRQDRSL